MEIAPPNNDRHDPGLALTLQTETRARPVGPRL